MRKLLILSIIIVSWTGLAYAGSVGAAPGSIDFGKVESGTTLEQKIYVTTNFNREFEVSPTVDPGKESQMFKGPERFETSEEDISDWVELPDSTQVDGTSSEQVQLKDSTFVTANGEFEVTINVPEDAEPGHHYGMIELNSQLGSEEEGAGTFNWGETVVPLRFRVKGNAERQLVVQDVRGFRTGESSAEVEILVRNAGTVTTTTEGVGFDVYDQRKNKKANLYTLGSHKLEPEDSKWLTAVWKKDEKIKEGLYQIDGNANYITGSATASGSFSLPDYDVVEVRPGDDQGEGGGSPGSEVPIWFVVILLVILGVLMWGFDVQPFWIVVVLAVLGISSFIILSGVPNLLVIILLILVGIVVYGGL